MQMSLDQIPQLLGDIRNLLVSMIVQQGIEMNSVLNPRTEGTVSSNKSLILAS